MADTFLDDDVSPGVPLSTLLNMNETADGHIVYFAVLPHQVEALYDALGHPGRALGAQVVAVDVADPGPRPVRRHQDGGGVQAVEGRQRVTCERAVHVARHVAEVRHVGAGEYRGDRLVHLGDDVASANP